MTLEIELYSQMHVDDYWKEVQETRCPECGLCFQVHMDDCSHNEDGREKLMGISIGDRVKKKSGKPFKSRGKINTVKDFTINPNTGKNAFAFIEDDSVVDAHQCISVNEKEISE